MAGGIGSFGFVDAVEGISKGNYVVKEKHSTVVAPLLARHKTEKTAEKEKNFQSNITNNENNP